MGFLSSAFHSLHLLPCLAGVAATQTPSGVNVNTADWDGNTSLHLAAKADNPGILQALLAAPGLDKKRANQQGQTALMCAVNHWNADGVKRLLQDAATDVNACDVHGDCPLHAAARMNQEEAVVHLLKHPETGEHSGEIF